MRERERKKSITNQNSKSNTKHLIPIAIEAIESILKKCLLYQLDGYFCFNATKERSRARKAAVILLLQYLTYKMAQSQLNACALVATK